MDRGTKLTNLNIRVFQKLSGEDDKVVTDKTFRKYLSEVVFKDFELPLHYQLRLDECLKEAGRGGDVGTLLNYMSAALGCCAFKLEDSGVTLRGLRYLENYPKLGELLGFLENGKKIRSLLKKNFSLYPTLVLNYVEIDGMRLDDVAFVFRKFGKYKLGLAGSPFDFKLAISFFEFLEGKLE